MDHVRIAYNTDRFDDTVAWWRDIMGLVCVHQWDRDDSRGAILSLSPGAEVEVFAAARGAEPLPPPPPDSFLIMMPSDDPAELLRRLEAKGAAIHIPLTEMPWATRFTLRDPNGVEVSVYRSVDAESAA